jgi:transposase-like protein
MSKSKKTDYSPETKAAVMAALLTGQAVGEISAQYNVPAATIRSWKSRQAHGGGNGVATVATQKKEEIGELLIQYLRESVKSLTAQAQFFADPNWLRQQEASQLAVLHGVQADKAMRLLEAFEGDDGVNGEAGHTEASN